MLRRTDVTTLVMSVFWCTAKVGWSHTSTGRRGGGLAAIRISLGIVSDISALRFTCTVVINDKVRAATAVNAVSTVVMNWTRRADILRSPRRRRPVLTSCGDAVIRSTAVVVSSAAVFSVDASSCLSITGRPL